MSFSNIKKVSIDYDINYLYYQDNIMSFYIFVASKLLFPFINDLFITKLFHFSSEKMRSFRNTKTEEFFINVQIFSYFEESHLLCVFKSLGR